jgi:hypothetical protein
LVRRAYVERACLPGLHLKNTKRIEKQYGATIEAANRAEEIIVEGFDRAAARSPRSRICRASASARAI